MSEFLKVLTFQEAQALLKINFPEPMVEYQPLERCRGRILAADIISPEHMPAFDRSTVDGYVLRAEDTFGSSETLPGMLAHRGEIEMGLEASFELKKGQCAWIPTGGMLPSGSNAVVMVEYTETLGDTILIFRPVAPGENVMHRGEDVSQGDPILYKDTILQAQHIGLLASLGISSLPVIKPYHVGVLSTGNEIIPIEQEPRLGQIRDVNTYALAAALESYGACPRRYPVVKDNQASLRRAMESALEENDLLIISGGSSVGAADFSIDVMLSFPEAEMLFHGIAVKPGKPTIGVRIGEKLVIGLPGHPVSALMVFNILCAPLISSAAVKKVEAVCSINLASQPGRDDFVPVKLEAKAVGWYARPLLGKSGLMSILAQADGYIHLPYEIQGIAAGERVTVNLF